MKKLYTTILLSLLSSIVLYSQIYPRFNTITSSIELDSFLYSEQVPGVEMYEFSVRNTDNSLNIAFTKQDHYFSLNEVPGIILYDSEYHIKVRYYISGTPSIWSPEITIQTVKRNAYVYGRVRLQFHQSEQQLYMNFIKTDNIIKNTYISGFNQLARSIGINDFRYPLQKFMELTDRHPYSCVDLIFDKSFSVDSVISFFNNSPYLQSIIPHYSYEYHSIPNEYNPDSDINNDGLPDFWHFADIDAPTAWQSIEDGSTSNAIIAIIDNVFYIDHEDLRANIYVNVNEIPAGLLTDQNQNGYIDAEDLLYYYNTILGYNYSGLRELFSSPPAGDLIFNGIDDDGNAYIDDICGWNIADNDNFVMPRHNNGSFISHGSHVAGIAGAISDNNTGICALNKNVRIIPLKLSSDYSSEGYGGSSSASIEDALEYIFRLREKPNVISMSLGNSQSDDEVHEMLSMLEDDYNITSVASTGNSSNYLYYGSEDNVVYPAMFDNVIAVGSSSFLNSRSDFSNYGDIRNTYVLAPGDRIYSISAGNITQSSYFTNRGTSMSTPIVSSLASLLYSKYPLITPSQVKKLIECGCMRNPNNIIHYNGTYDGFGKINAYQTLVCLNSMLSGIDIISYAGTYCPDINYTFEGMISTPSENNIYNWSVSGGNYTIIDGADTQNLTVNFNETGIYTLTLVLTNGDSSREHSVNIETAYPEVIIINENISQTPEGFNTQIYLQLTGHPPFSINYILDGNQYSVNNIESGSYILNLQTQDFEAGSTHSFSINHFSDAFCEGIYNGEYIHFIIEEFPIQCGGMYNNVMHFNSIYATTEEPAYGLYFNPNPQLENNPFIPELSSNEGPASICDFNGNPVLSATGGNIYCTKAGCGNSIINPEPVIPFDEIMSSTQGHLILPNPSDTAQYFVFMVTHNGVGTNNRLVWGTVDFSSSQCGEYIPGGVFYNGEVEKLTACRIDGENGYWILTNGQNSNKFNIYKILDSNGILTYNTSQIINTPAQTNIGLGEMKFNLAMDLLAVGFSSSNVVELYRFNRSTGFSGNRLELIGRKSLSYSPYSLEFSPDGKLLYVMTAGYITQIRIDNFIQHEPEVIFNSVLHYGSGLSLGPDMKIYVNTNPTISVILSPNNIGSSCNFMADVFPNKVTLSLPQRIPLIGNSQNLNYIISDCSFLIYPEINSVGEPTSFLWSTGDTSPEILVTEGGTYSVTVSYGEMCDLSSTITIPDIVNSINLDYRSENCVTRVYIETNLMDYPASYLWNIGAVSPDIIITEGGTYSLTVSYSGCTMHSSITIPNSEVFEEVEISDIQTVPSCPGQFGGSITISATGGITPYAYEWAYNNNNISGSNELTNLEPGNYSVTVMDNVGCTSSAAILIEDNFGLEIISRILMPCENIQNGSVSLTVSNGLEPYSYSWENLSFGNNSEITGIGSGVYNVTVSDSRGCTSVKENVLSTSSLDIFINNSGTACANNSDASLTALVSGGNEPYTYIWRNENLEIISTLDVVENINFGLYYLEVSDVNGCSTLAEYTIPSIPYPEINLEVLNNPCPNQPVGSVLVTVEGGVSPFAYSYGNHNGNINGDLTIQGLSSGTFSISITDGNNCVYTESVVITNNPSPQVTISDIVRPCQNTNGGSLNVNISGGSQPYHYSYTGNNGYTNNIVNVTGLSSGNFIITITDNNGCSVSKQQSVQSLPLPQVNIADITPALPTTNNLGSAKAVVINAQGTYTYLWSSGETGITATSLPAGINYVTVTASNGCSATAAVNIPGIEVISNIGVHNDCYYISGSEEYFYPSTIPQTQWGDYTYSWKVDGIRNYSNEPEMRYAFTTDGFYCIELTVSGSNFTSTSHYNFYVYPDQCYCKMDINNLTHFENIKVSESDVWEGRYLFIKDTLEIQSGSTLEIHDSKLHFSPSGVVIVKPGATLLCYGTTFTSFNEAFFSCNHMWQGIEVWGNPNESQNNIIQGKLKFFNRSGVSNAYIGVLVGARSKECICTQSPSNHPGFLEPAGGGIININNAEFANNGEHIWASPYDYYSSSYIINSEFNCPYPLLDEKFNITHPLKYTSNHRYNLWAKSANRNQRTHSGINVWKISGIQIDYCSFKNVEEAISSYDSKHVISRITIDNASTGIRFYNSTSPVNYGREIYGCNFINITDHLSKGIAIYLQGSINDYIHDNNFGRPFDEQDMHDLAIYSNNASGFKITENNFSRFKEGLRVHNSNNSGGFVGAGLSWDGTHWEGNIFTDCKKSIITSSNNSKLKLDCNRFEHTEPHYFSINIESSGSLATQGVSMPRFGATFYSRMEMHGAGNEFEGNSSIPKLVISTTNTAYNYNHHNNEETIPQKYGDQTYAMLNLTNINVTKTTNENTCNRSSLVINRTPQKYMSEELIIRRYSSIDSLKDIIKKLEDEYNYILKILDNGNTIKLLEEIKKPDDPYKFKERLLKSSPLSDTVLKSLIVEFPLPEDYFMEVMAQNLPVSNDVYEYLEIRFKKMDKDRVEKIKRMNFSNSHIKIPTAALIVREIESIEIDYNHLLNDILYVLTDKKNKTYDLELALEFLRKEESFHRRQMLISTYIDMGKYEVAEEELVELKPQTKQESEWIAYTGFLLKLKRNGRSFHSIDEKEHAFLKEIAGSCPAGLAAANAQSVLKYYFGIDIPDCEESIKKESKIIEESIFKNPVETAYIGENFPEPFDKETNIEYFIPEGLGKIKIIDIFGKIMAEYRLYNGNGILKINTSGWQPGVYFYCLIVNGSIIDNKKMILTK